jgi:hypothetical protein
MAFWLAILLHLLQEQKFVAALERSPDRPIHHLTRRRRSDILRPSGHAIAFRRLIVAVAMVFSMKRLTDHSPTDYTFMTVTERSAKEEFPEITRSKGEDNISAVIER